MMVIIVSFLFPLMHPLVCHDQSVLVGLFCSFICLLPLLIGVRGLLQLSCAFQKKKKKFILLVTFPLERENPHLKTFLCPSQEVNVVCVFLNFLCRISRWRNLTGGSTTRTLLMPFNQPNKWRKLCKKAVLFHLPHHQASIQVCGSVYPILDLVPNSSKVMSSSSSQLDFSFVPLCTTPCEHWLLPYIFFLCFLAWGTVQWRGSVGKKRKITVPSWLIKVASLEPGVSALERELRCPYTANGTIVWQSVKHVSSPLRLNVVCTGFLLPCDSFSTIHFPTPAVPLGEVI